MEDRRAKIVATMGPASQDETTLMGLIQAGMNVARLNFSHGSHADHAQTFEKIRAASKRLGIPVAIMQDLQGVKIRTGKLQEPVQIEAGQKLILTTAAAPLPGQIPVDYPELHHYLAPGGRILLDDGNLELLVDQVAGQDIETTVILGGALKSHKGINLPGVKLDIPGFTDKDESDLAFGLQLGVDAVAVSFVRSAEDVARVRIAITQTMSNRSHPLVIAKLERPEAVDNLEEIIDISDGVMVARGDLGVEMNTEAVPIIQKQIIASANLHKKIVITATQMLDSMIHNPRPTRAEATDVANAIFDGTDAVMLSGETAIGQYPIQTVKMMKAIICQAEKHLSDWGRWHGTPTERFTDDAVAITSAARELAHDLNVAAVVVFTQSGRTARLMSKASPRVPILAFTPDQQTYQRMAFHWGVYPHLIPFADTIEEMLSYVESAMLASTTIKAGQQVVVISGFPVGTHRLPNIALLHTLGQNS